MMWNSPRQWVRHKRRERLTIPRKTVHNKLTTPGKIKRINPENAQLRDEFLDYLRSVQRSPTTIAAYESDLNIVFVYMLEHMGNRRFVDLRKRDIVRLQNWLLNENQNSPARVRRVKATLSSLSNFIENVLDEDC